LRETRAARALAEVVWRKTGGNPFIRQFLETLYDKLIAYDAAARACYDIARIEAESITDNVAELLARKLDRLPGFTRLPQPRRAIGNDFDLETLAIVRNVPRRKRGARGCRAGRTRRTDLAAREPGSGTPRLFSSISVTRSPRPHSAGGVRDHSGGGARGATSASGASCCSNDGSGPRYAHLRTFILNHGMEVIEEPAERLQLAKLNLRAGARARKSTANALAVQCFRNGIELLGAGAWLAHYEMAYELHAKLAECLCLTADYPGALVVLQEATAHARPGADRSKLHTLEVIVCASRGDMRAALECAAGGREHRHPHVRDTCACRSSSNPRSRPSCAGRRRPGSSASTCRACRSRSRRSAHHGRPRMPAASQLDRPLYQLMCCRVVALCSSTATASSAKDMAPSAVIRAVSRPLRRCLRFGKLGADPNARLDDMSMRSSVYRSPRPLGLDPPVAESIELFRQGIRHVAPGITRTSATTPCCITHPRPPDAATELEARRNTSSSCTASARG
jgi:hypothetical protein